MSTSSLAIPAVVHKAPKQDKPASDGQNVNAIALSLKSAVEELVQGASRTLQEVKTDPYGFPTALPSDDKGEQKTFMAAMRDFEELCDQMYLVVESARDALLQRVNDTHSLADESILARTQASAAPEEGAIKADAAMVAYTAAATAQIAYAGRTREILSAFCEDYVEKQKEPRGPDVADTSVLNISLDDLSVLATS